MWVGLYWYDHLWKIQSAIYVFILPLLNRLIQGLGSLLSPFILILSVIYEYADVKQAKFK